MHFYTAAFNLFARLLMHVDTCCICYFRCQICEKRFSRSDHLAKHLKVHRRDRLYSYLATMGYGTPSRRGRLSQNILNNEERERERERE
jgi:hypothetical protein